MTRLIGPAVREDFRRLYPANAKTPTCCPSDDSRTNVTNSVTSARSLWWHLGPYFLARGSDADGELHLIPFSVSGTARNREDLDARFHLELGKNSHSIKSDEHRLSRYGQCKHCKTFLSEITCPSTPAVAHAFITSEEDVRTYGSEVNITCLPGYHIDGRQDITVECLEHGNWSISTASCQRM